MIEKFYNDFDQITAYYEYLVEKTKNFEYVGITNEWLIDNYYVLVENRNNIIKEEKRIRRKLRYAPYINNVLKKIITKNNYNIDSSKLIKELNNYQKENDYYFSYREIELITTLLFFNYTHTLLEICNEEKHNIEVVEQVDYIIDRLKTKEYSLKELVTLNGKYYEDYNFIYELNNDIKKLGHQYTSCFRELNDLLEEKDISLKDAINKAYQSKIDNNILVSNIFNNLKEFFELSIEELYESVSHAEKRMMKDEIYKGMTIETKNEYRKRVMKLAKKAKMSEYEYISSLMKNKDNQDKHIGFLLFKDHNYNLRFAFYLLIVVALSIVITYAFSKNFINNKIMGFAILFIPVMQLVLQVINALVVNINKPTPIFKMDYRDGIPEEDATMVVIPTIVSDTKKVKEMFDTLETYYIINKSSNLYFTLLGDAKACDKEIMPFDEEITEFGINYADKLNKKYRKEIFFFIYRKREWNPKENQFLGYERKRGNLLEFNRLLLHKMSEKDKERFYHANTLENFDTKIKYIITLDTDTKLVLNTALNLVGAMAHPLNTPILNKEGTKVVRGYGMMQPRVSVDIESTNKSIYSQVFASIGGFDSYSSLVPNAFQDLFNEGSFIGKGIYDLEMFDKIMYNTCPENLILSHDLLEGNYMRCGFVGDIELIDDFPSKFLTDASRQHRWARGDVQIISWLFPFVRNKKLERTKNPINALGKFKILDNIARMFLQPGMLIILILAIYFSKANPLWWILLVVVEIFLPIIDYLRTKFAKQDKSLTRVYYKDLIIGGNSILLRSYIVLACIPYYTRLYMDAFFRTLYRLFISHKNLLNWITAEDAEKTAKSDLPSYLLNFYPNLLVGIVLVLIGIFKLKVLSIIFGIIFISAPFILYKVSLPIPDNSTDLTSNEKNELIDIARSTWNYFRDNLKEEYNYLIPDNYQENREKKVDPRTSPTDISYSILAVICANNMDFIDEEKAIDLLKKIVDSVEGLKTWNGHLYNWYNIKTKEALPPFFVSTVDSGNFVASLMVLSEYFKDKEIYDYARRVDHLVREANFKKLYIKKNVFSIGYDENEAKLSIYNYNKFASESRLTSYVAICKGDVSSKHWFSLDKSLTSYNFQKGLISWSGTSFEYYMPYLYMRNYKNTLLDEAYRFAHMCQKEYIESVDKSMPWGISECAYDELDNAQNYKYKAFSTPLLKAKEEKETRVVVSPYSSLMALKLFPEDVYKNTMKYKDINMLGKYGLYESFDLDTNKPVKAFFAHHQGMSLVGIANYLCDGLIQNYFHENVGVKTFDILLKEKVQLEASIDMKIAKYKKYDYDKEKIENDIRWFNDISDMPEVSVLSNKKYCLLMNDRGNSFSRYRTIQLNRYRKITEQDYGYFLYVKDLKTKKVWSNTYAPINTEPDKYEIVFSSDKIKYIRSDNNIITSTEIVVTKEHNAEIRKVTFTNNTDKDKVLEVTSYMEPTICENMHDVSHRVFSSMFLESSYDEETNSLITMRKPREDGETNVYVINRLVIDEPLEAFQYETDRFSFIGRNHDASNPAGLDKPLTNTIGVNVEPVMALRNRIEVKANDSTTIYMINGFGRSKEQLMDIVDAYNDKLSIKKAFEVSNLMNIVNTTSMDLTGEEMRLYNIMLNYLYQTTKITVNEERKELLKKNSYGQNGLWKFGVSGDRPIILVEIKDVRDISFVEEILACFEYYKSKSIFVDIIIINSEDEDFAKIIKEEVESEVYRMNALNSFDHMPGNVYLIDRKDITDKDMSLLRIVPRLTFILEENRTLKDYIDELQNNNMVSPKEKQKLQTNLRIKYDASKLDYVTDFGGFTKKGDEYVVFNKDTPTPWSNVICNEKMGTVVTNNGNGFTFAYNSGEYKITSWTNDMICNDKSEGIKINGEIFDPTVCRHGFGYSVLSSETEKLKEEVTEFVAKDDTVKFYLVKLTNKLFKAQSLDVSYWLNPTFGNFEEKTARHILSEFMGKDNFMKIRNVYSVNYSNVVVSMSSSEPITKAIDNKVLIKEIVTHINLGSKEEKYILFTLSTALSDKELLSLVDKYKTVKSGQKELKNVQNNWNDILNIVDVKTPDKSLDNVLNGWYLYNAISARLFGKTGLYQVSGAFGFRDQLQDAMNIALVRPDLTRRQILLNAEHQFREGDVLHWWHEINHFGIRSRYKDDFLWLVYATCEYVETTGDKGILKEEVSYAVGDKLKEFEKEKGLTFSYSEDKHTLLEHLEAALNLSINNIGSHGIPLIGGEDWSDGMNKDGIKGKGESVWLGFFLYIVIEKFTKMMKSVNPKYKTSDLLEFNKKLKDSLNENCWDGKYYLRAFFDNGASLGGHDNSECKIDLIAQSFAILSNVANKERRESSLDAVKEMLVDKENGLVKLLTPAFHNSINDPGYIMRYPVGLRENGGQYTHAVSWYIMALIEEGKYEEAYQVYSMINPINKTKTNQDVYRYKIEPYVISADIYTNPRYPGRGGWSWYTGSAGWFYKVGVRDILGFYKEGNTVYIKPHVPKKWSSYKIRYKYLDTNYQFNINLSSKDVVKLDGKELIEKKVILTNDSKEHVVDVYVKGE